MRSIKARKPLVEKETVKKSSFVSLERPRDLLLQKGIYRIDRNKIKGTILKKHN